MRREKTVKEKDMRTNVILPESLWEKAKIQATMERVSFTEIVRRALKEYLEKKEPQRKNEKEKVKGDRD
jgi:metal-responsive CopG/Arc/MetJ family transcriptional regulator